GLSPDRPPWSLRLLRGVHPHHRLDVQPARQVAEDGGRDSMAAADRVAQLPPLVTRVAPGPQRLLAPGSGVHRPCDQTEARGYSRVPCAGRELPAFRDGPLPAQDRKSTRL